MQAHNGGTPEGHTTGPKKIAFVGYPAEAVERNFSAQRLPRMRKSR
jgi:hypothetical protein